MTLGCGSWGGNVTSDNVSPLHLLDIKRVAFEVRPVQSKRPAVSATTVTTLAAAPPSPAPAYASSPPAASKPQVVGAGGGKINREDIAAIVDRFLAGRQPEEAPRGNRPQPSRQPEPEAEAGSMYAGPNQQASQSGNGGRSSGGERSGSSATTNRGSASQSANGGKTVDFVSEDDVKRALQKGEKIYINAKTIITPAARDIGEPAEIFAKV
jgi:acetaldehyde dehydrogenase (acetylating)